MFETDNIITAKPEECGIASANVLKFLKSITNHGQFMHSFILIKNEKLLAEGYTKPFNKDFKHRLYSITKSFGSMAIGRLYTEGKIKLDDKVYKYFPEYKEEELHPYIKMATIRDLLMMSTPFDDQTYRGEDMNWIETFFKVKPATHQPGTVWQYDTSASYILGVIVERITGKGFFDYLQETVLSKIGFSEDAFCVKAPEGYQWAGSGVVATPRDLVKFATLLMNKGKYNGEQLIAEDYVVAATTRQIDNNPRGNGTILSCGYGYQVWMIPNGFALYGMGGQFALCIPEEKLLFVCNGDLEFVEANECLIIENFYNYIVNNLGESAEYNEADYTALTMALNSMTPPIPKSYATKPIADEIDGKVYEIDAGNPMGIKDIKFTFDEKGGKFCYNTDRGYREIPFLIDDYLIGEFPETHYSGTRINHPLGRGYKSMTCGTWAEDHKLMLRIYVTDFCFGNAMFTFSFKEDYVGIVMFNNCEWYMDEYYGFTGGHLKK